MFARGSYRGSKSTHNQSSYKAVYCTCAQVTSTALSKHILAVQSVVLASDAAHLLRGRHAVTLERRTTLASNGYVAQRNAALFPIYLK